MGKKRRRKQKRPLTRRIPWLWLGLGGAAVLALGLLLWQPWSGDEPSVTPQVSGAPRLRVDQTVVDEGYVRYSVPVRTTFRLTNVGDQPLEILNQPQVQLVEGC